MFWFIQNIVFSISLIVIIHYLYLYFKSTLTTPKVKDLINCPKLKYNSLFETINRKINHEGGPASAASATSAASAASTAATRSGLGIVNRKNNGGSDLGDYDDTDDYGASSSSSSSVNRNAAMKNDLKSFLRTIGLKKQSTQQSRAPYEMN
jgi:hypothetical protein